MTPKHAVSLIESAYRLDLSTESWLEGIAAAASEALGSKQGAMAFRYDASSKDWIHVQAFAMRGLAPEFVTAFFNQSDAPPDVARQLATLMHSVRFGSTIDLFERTGAGAFMRPTYDRYGIADMLGINGLDPSGRGCMLMVATSRARYSPRTTHLWHRLAAHVSAGNRLRSALDELAAEGVDPVNRAEAVLSPNGNVDHATGAAEPRTARRALRDALVRIDQARSIRDDARESVELWRGLVAGRWSLVEHFERDGRRYYLAHKNDPELAPDRALTQREQQVLGYAELGHSNKLISYQLDLSSSTVSSLLTSARRKLGAFKRSGNDK
jgi:DNA-binding CsgD family transcriptional regulator